MIVRITYHVLPTGVTSPVVRMSCGRPRDDKQAAEWVARYAGLAARQHGNARPGDVTDGRCLVTRPGYPGPLATIEIEPPETT